MLSFVSRYVLSRGGPRLMFNRQDQDSGHTPIPRDQYGPITNIGISNNHASQINGGCLTALSHRPVR